MADQDLKIKITTQADVAGAQQAAASIEKIDKGAKSAAPAVAAVGKSSADMARGLGEGAAVGNAAVSAMTNLDAASRGGASGLLAIARAAFAAGVSFKGLLTSMGPFGIAAAAIGIALGLMSAALRKSEEATADAKQKIDELNKAKLDDAVKQQQALESAANLALQKIEAEYTAMQRIADAELARRKSGVDADVAEGKITGQEGERRKTALDRQREDEKRVALLGAAEAKAQTLEGVEREAAKQAAAKTAEYERQTKLLADLDAAQKAMQSAQVAIQTGGEGGIGAGLEDYEKANVAQQKFEAARKAAEGIDQSTSETAKKLADDQAKQVEADRKRAQDARAAADTERNTQTVEDPLRAETRRNEDRAKRERTDSEEAAAKKAQAEQDAKIRRTPAAIWNNRIASGDTSVDAEAVKRNYPGYKFTERPKSDAPAAPMTPTESVADLAAKAAAETAAKAAAAKPSGGTMIGSDGQVINTAARQPTGPSMIGRDGRPVAVQPGQPAGKGRGAYREGSDNKLAEQTKDLNDTMKQAGEKAGEKVDLQPAVDGAKKVQVGNEQLKSALADATSVQAMAMQAARDALDEAVLTLGDHAGAIRAIKSELSALKAQARAAKVK